MGESRLHYGMSLRLYFEEKAFGPGMVMLLREVERTGSLQKAAKNMNMAYSKAWKNGDLPLQTVRPGGKTAAVPG